MEQLDEMECDTIVKYLGLFLEALDELKTNESCYLLDMARICGHNCSISDAMIEDLIKESEAFRKRGIIQMNDEIQENENIVLKENNRRENDSQLIADLHSKARSLENEIKHASEDATNRVLSKNELQLSQLEAEIKKNEEQIKSKRTTINELKNKTNELRNKSDLLLNQINNTIAKRRENLCYISLISMTILLDLTEFLLVNEKWLALVPTILSTLLVLYILAFIDEIVKEKKFNYPIFLISLVPILLINLEVFFIYAICEWKWLLTFFITIPTVIIFVCLIIFEEENESGKEMAIHNISLTSLGIIVSLAEFFTFGNSIFPFFDDGWGWALVSFAANIYFVCSRLGSVTDIHVRELPKYEYWLSLFLFASLTVVAFCTHHLWKLLLIPLSVGLSLLAHFISDKAKHS